MKSAYELALERLAAGGIEPPRADALSDDQRERIAAIRAKADAELAQVEILHRDRAARLAPGASETAEQEYRIDRERIVARREAEVERVRRGV